MASILLAFAIDAWWDDRQLDQDREVARAGLEADFRQNLVALATTRDGHQRSLDATRTLLSLIGPDTEAATLDQAEIGPILLRALASASFDPRTGTLQSLIASGRLDLVTTPELRYALTEWPSKVAFLKEWEAIERTHAEQTLAHFTNDYVAWPDVLSALDDSIGLDLGFEESRFDSDLEGLFRSMRFEGLLSNRSVNLTGLIQIIDDLEASAEDIADRLGGDLDT